MRIDIWSDVICPWCHLGKRRFDQALEQLEWADEIEIRWRAFRLDPSATTEPTDLERAIDAKYGPGAFVDMSRRLTSLGEAIGISYRFDLALRVTTVDAHRLLAWAYAIGGGLDQSRLQERLFQAYFEQGRNLADQATLVGLAAEVGLDEVEADRVLSSDRFRVEVAGDLAAAADRGITSVPSFVIDDRLLIPGAQDPDTIVAVLTRARERVEPQP